jgi:hypothetical protein
MMASLSERAFEAACRLAAAALLALGACLFLRFDPSGPTVLQFVSRGGASTLLLPAFVAPAFMGIVTLLSSAGRRAPHLASFVTAAVFAAASALAAFVLWVLLMKQNAGETKSWTFVLSFALSPLALVVLARSRGKGAWGRWAHAIASVGLSANAVGFLIGGEAVGGAVGYGLDLWLGATALLLPLSVWMAWPRALRAASG